MKKIYLAYDEYGVARVALKRIDALNLLKWYDDYKVVCVETVIPTFQVPLPSAINEMFVRKSDGIYYEKE